MFLFGLFIYTYISVLSQMIRLISLTISGRAYLNFMGNEFGHPEVTLLASASTRSLFHVKRD